MADNNRMLCGGLVGFGDELELHFRETKSSKQEGKPLKTNETLPGDQFENKDEGGQQKRMLESHNLQEISSSILNYTYNRFNFMWTKILAAADMDEAMFSMQQFCNGLQQAILNLCEMK